MLLGLTGGYCAGKNVAAGMLGSRGFLCFDLDKLGHKVLEQDEVVSALVGRFGDGILDAERKLDRKALGARVFTDAEALAWEEGIVHPAVYLLLRPRMEAALAEGRDVCLNAALLYRMPEASRCDAILEVKAPLLIRVRRGRARDGLSALAILNRVRRQRSFWTLRKNYPGLILNLRNKGDEAALAKNLDRALKRIRGFCSQGSANIPEHSRR